MAENPAGKLTQVFVDGAELEGAYRFVESDNVSTEELERARGEACARRLAQQEVAIIPVDQTSIKLREHRNTERMGSVGTRSSKARGVHAMVGLGLDPEGVTMGVLGMVPWVRSEEPTPPRKNGRKGKRKDARPAEERESFNWIRTFDLCHEQLRLHAPNTRGWYQVDQGADYWRVFEWACTHEAWLTARICHERVVLRTRSEVELHAWIKSRPVAYRFDLELPEQPQRPARTAHLSVRYETATIRYMVTKKEELHLTLSVVAVNEPRPPEGAAPIDWFLLTNFPVETDEDAQRVIDNYTRRWRCEDFFRTLKSGACEVESSELESLESFSRFLIVASSVAARVERIRYLSRTHPDAPATVAFSKREITMAIQIREQYGSRVPARHEWPDGIPPLHLMTRWVAELGGYRPARHRGPPGSIVLTRGLIRLQTAVLGAMAQTRRHQRCD